MASPPVLMHPGPDAGPKSAARPFVDALLAAGEDVESLTLRSLAANPRSTVHVHWPEHVVADARPLHSAYKSLRSVFLLGILRLRKHRLLITMHNVEPHEPLNVAARFLAASLKRLATDVVVLTKGQLDVIDAANLGHATPHVIPFGSLAPTTRPRQVPTSRTPLMGLMIGHIAPYKGHLEAIRGLYPLLESGKARLVIVGRPESDRYIQSIREAAHDFPDQAVVVHDRFVPDDELATIVGKTHFAVGVQIEGLNSGVPFAMLPAGIPVLMSPSLQSADLAEQYPGWVEVVNDVSEPESWQSSLDRLMSFPRTGDAPSLAWDPIIAEYQRLYR